MIDVNRYIKMNPKADNVDQKVSAKHVNLLQSLVEHNQQLLFKLRDEDFKQGCRYALEHHPGVNVLWLDLMGNTDKLDLVNSQDVEFSEAERAVIFGAESSALTAILYSKPYTIAHQVPIKDFILQGTFYVPSGCSINISISNNGGADFFPIDPFVQNPLTRLSTDGNTLVLRAVLTRTNIETTPRIDNWALLFWDPTVGTISLAGGGSQAEIPADGVIDGIGEVYHPENPGGGTLPGGGVELHDELGGVTEDQHHPKSHVHGQDGIPKIDLTKDASGILPYQNLPEKIRSHAGMTDVGPDDHHAANHKHGMGGIAKVNLEEDTIGILPKEQLPFDLDEQGNLIPNADVIPIGSPGAGKNWSQTIAQWTVDTNVAKALYDLGSIMAELAPADAPTLAGSLTGGPARVSGKLSAGLPASYYTDGKAAGATVDDLVTTLVGTWVVPEFNKADTGLLILFIDGVQVAAIDLAANFNEALRDGDQDISAYNTKGAGSSLVAGVASFPGGTLAIRSVGKYNNFKKWQSGRAEVILDGTVLSQGVHALQVKRQTPEAQETAAYKLRYDGDATTPQLANDPVVAQNTLNGKRLSGVRYYAAGDKFDVNYSFANGYRNAYHPVAVSTIRMPGAVDLAVNPAIVPTFDEVAAINQLVTLNKADIVSLDARATVTVQDPYGHADTRLSAAVGRMIHTYGQKSTTVEEYFCDEAYRLPLTHDFEDTVSPVSNLWNSALPLVSGNAQCYIANDLPALVYPSRNFAVACLPFNDGVNYSAFAGNQVYARAFSSAEGQASVVITLTGSVAGLAAVGGGDINIEIKLPGISGWGDVAKPYSAAENPLIDGWGMLNGDITFNGTQAIIIATFGGLNTIDCGKRIYMRITMRNANGYINSVKVGW